MNSKQPGRRRFLKDGAVLAGLAVGAMRSASGETLASDTPATHPRDSRALGERARFETSLRSEGSVSPNFWLTPLQDSVGIITPSGLHFSHNHYGIPDIDPRQHRLLIHGMVDRPVTLTVEELRRLPFVSQIHFVECVGNSRRCRSKDAKNAQDCYGRLAGSEWTGVPVSLLLKEAGVQKGAAFIVAESADGGKWVRGIPLDKAMDDCLVCYSQNGEAVRPEQGYPLRLLVPGWEGNLNVKWLRQIKVVDVADQTYLTESQSPKPPEKGHWEFEQSARSLITYPSGEHRLTGPGFYEISGLAWSGGGVIRKVEVSTDGGRTWKEAQLQQPVLPKALTRFSLGWNWGGEETMLQSRCTDELGNGQPTLAEFSKSRGVNVDYWQSNGMPSHTNPIFGWAVSRDGSVKNALV